MNGYISFADPTHRLRGRGRNVANRVGGYPPRQVPYSMVVILSVARASGVVRCDPAPAKGEPG